MRNLNVQYALLLALLFIGCSDNSTNEPAVKDEYAAWKYINAFAHGAMNKYYLWKNEIAKDLDTWDWEWSEPKSKVIKLRYKENSEETDRWTQLYENYSERTTNISTTYGFEYALYQLEASKQALLITTLVYPGSPAEKAGLKRGSLIVALNNEPITTSNYKQLKTLPSIELFVQTSSNQKTLKLQATNMYEDPVVLDSIYRFEDKKVGYLVYTRFDVSSCEKLIDICKRFKQEGLNELILDLRYNSGGTSVVHQLLASMLAPEQDVINGNIYLKRTYNEDYTETLLKKGEELEQRLQSKLEWSMNGKDYAYDVSDANIGLTKLYALVTKQTASASEALLIGLKPYLDIEIIGETTSGKYCGGYNLSATDWYREQVDTYKKEGRDFYTEHPELSDWESYVADWGMYIIIDYFTDREGTKPNIGKGLLPDLEATDTPFETYPLGDEREVMLRAALTRAGKTDMLSRTIKSRSMNDDFKLIEFSSEHNFVEIY